MSCTQCGTRATLKCRECELPFCSDKCINGKYQHICMKRAGDFQENDDDDVVLIIPPVKRDKVHVSREQMAEKMSSFFSGGGWASVIIEEAFSGNAEKVLRFLNMPEQFWPFWVEYPEFWDYIANRFLFSLGQRRKISGWDLYYTKLEGETVRDYVLRNRNLIGK